MSNRSTPCAAACATSSSPTSPDNVARSPTWALGDVETVSGFQSGCAECGLRSGRRQFDPKLTDAYNLGDRYVTMFGYERSVSYPEGHRNTVFAQRGIRPLPRLEWKDGPAVPMAKTKLGRLKNGQPYDLLARVTTARGRVRINLSVDRITVFEWEGQVFDAQNGINFFTNI